MDKTNTVTEGCLELKKLSQVSTERRGGSPQEGHRKQQTEIVYSIRNFQVHELLDELGEDRMLSRALSACHALSLVGGQPVGSAIDVLSFKASHGRIDESSDRFIHTSEGHCLEILFRYSWSSSKAYMGVIARIEDTFWFFCKGSPDTISRFCDVYPQTIQQEVNASTAEGLRVIAIAGKQLEISRSEDDLSFSLSPPSREIMENGLKILGLIGFVEKLHPNSSTAIRELQNAGIAVFLGTGDAELTALSVARDVGIDPSISRKSVIHARADPLAKAALIKSLQKGAEISGEAVMMVGDGPNDAAAISVADVGVLLNGNSNSNDNNNFLLSNACVDAIVCTDRSIGLGCIPEIIRYGRANLSKLIAVTQCTVAYAVIQATSVLICYGHSTNFAVTQYVYVDMLVLATLLIFIFFAKGKNSLLETRINRRSWYLTQLSYACMSAIFLQIILYFGIGWLQLSRGPAKWISGTNFQCQANTVIFVFSGIQIILAKIKFFKDSGDCALVQLFDNYVVMGWLLVLIFCASEMVLQPELFEEYLCLVPIPISAKIMLAVLSAAQFGLLAIVSKLH